MNLRLLLPLAAASGVAILVSDDPAAPPEAPPPHAVPWRRVTWADPHPPGPAPRSVLLFVAATCPHCEGTARYADSALRAHGRPFVIVSPDADSTMQRWRSRTGVRATLGRDTDGAMRRALGVRFVPTLVAWDATGHGVRIVGADRVALRRALEATR